MTINEVAQYVAGLASLEETLPDPEAIGRITRDPSDDYLVALARGAGADAIVSGDADLLTLEGSEPPILSPAAFIEGMGCESA